MARNGPERGHSYRDSYVAKEIQGHLEKKKGVLGTKTRLWCSVQESTLCMQKKQGEPLQTIDLKDSHLVRKVTSDVTGTNFEICMKKKTHVFICPTSEDCTAWVRCLQAAMALKDYGQIFPDQETDAMEDINIYHSPDDESSPQGASNDRAALKQEYTEALDALSNHDSPCNENLYYEIENVRVSPPEKPQRKERVSSCKGGGGAVAAASTTETNPEMIYSDAISETAKTAAKSPADSNSTEETIINVPLPQRAPLPPQRALSTRLISVSIDPASLQPSPDANPTTSGGISPRRQSHDPASLQPSPDANPTTSGGISNKQSIDPISPKPSPDANPTTSGGIFLRRPSHDQASLQPSPATNSPASGRISQKEQSSDEEDNLFEILEEALTSGNSPIPDFIHPLTDKDRTPINDLTCFLRSNVELCRLSPSLGPTTEDPVNVLKSYLKIASRKIEQS